MSIAKLLVENTMWHPLETAEPEPARARAIQFIQGKLALSLAGFIYYVFILGPRLEFFVIFTLFATVDLLSLVPYYYWTKRKPSTLFLATQLCVALTVVRITVDMHFAGDYAQPTVVAYFLLVPIVSRAIPFPRVIWIVAGQVTIAYLTLVVLEVGGLVPMFGNSKPHLQEGLGYAAIVIVAMWLFALSANRRIMVSQVEHRKAALLEGDARRSAQAESIWSTVGKTVISTQDLDRVLTTVIQIIREKMDVEAGSVLLREPGTDDITFAKILHGTTERFATTHLKVGQGIIGWVVSNGKPIIVQDVARDPRWFGGVDQVTGFITRSVLCVPLIATDEVIGAIELLNKQGSEFNQTDMQLLESIAAPVAIAVQNARLHQFILSQLDDLTVVFRLVENAKKEWEATVDAIDQGILVTDASGRILRVNDTLAGWVRTPSHALAGKLCCEVIHGSTVPPSYCPHAQLMAANDGARNAEIEEPRLGGIFHASAYPLRDTDGTHIGAVTVLKNVTEEKQLEAQLIQSEKMAATGRLAASLAHEINNPLQAIQGCLELAQAEPTDYEKQQRHLTMARAEVERLAAMVQAMLDFYRPFKDVRSLVSAQKLLDDVLTLGADRLKAANVSVKTEWYTNIPLIKAVANQIIQLFLNLILNAAEAMPKGGTLEIRGGVVEEGEWLTIDFTDQGRGIPAQEFDSIFKPFYTTRTNGTGLGLSVCQGIVTSHGGRLSVSSTVGKGSTFSVWLPTQVTEDD